MFVFGRNTEPEVGMDLGLVDVEWAGDGGLRRSPLSAVHRVEFETAAPVRRFASYRGQRHFPGWYWAATTCSLVGFESWLERDRVMLLDHDRRVIGLSSQPFRVSWPGATRLVSHTPDYFARLEDGSAVVIDVRPRDRVGPHDAEKFSATESMCQALDGWSYVLVHEPDPLVMANVRWLSGYRHPRYRVAGPAGRLLDAFDEPRLLADGAWDAGDPLEVLPTLFHLLWSGELEIDLTAPLGDGSQVVRGEGTDG
ncbi:TnsA-like heteromeric transposase endonuclease subunit [Streptomyces sp. NPDC058451]|uniref:TnsA-like heteromeric transposase endonuclease subunit n=1 Tax=unclassified Streptomyces TaxID=2593676 RepID=UPI00365876CE